ARPPHRGGPGTCRSHRRSRVAGPAPGWPAPGWPASLPRRRLAAPDRGRGVDLVRGDLEDDPALRADRVAVVVAVVLAGQLVDVLARLLPGDGLDDTAAHLGPVPRVVTGVDEHS